MTVGLVLGALIGLGLVSAIWGLFPPREPLQARLAELEQTVTESRGAGSRKEQVGRAAAQSFGRLGLRGDRIERNLRVAGQTLEQLAIAKLGMLMLGAGLPVVVWIATWFSGIWISPVPVVAVSIAVGALFFFVPDLLLRQKAQKRHRDLRHQLSVFLDLVHLHLAGGAGMERALADSAAQGTAWGFVEIERALKQAQLSDRPPWAMLQHLARDLGSSDLEELAAWLLLAGTSGSRVRTSLRTMAHGLRERALHEAETEAQQATERMSLPVVLMFTGFLGLIGYPAFAAIIGS